MSIQIPQPSIHSFAQPTVILTHIPNPYLIDQRQSKMFPLIYISFTN